MEVATEKPTTKTVPEGLKRTEVGVLPEDWQILKLDDYTIKIGSGITPRGGRKVYTAEGRPFIRSQNVDWGYLNLDDLAFIDEKTHKSFDATELMEDDVLLNITGASIGRSTMVTDKIVGGNVNQHVCIIRTLKEYIEPKYLNFVLISNIGQDQVASHQAGGNREGLNFGQIGKFKIPTPPTLDEQRAIAGALSDVDALIAALDALIEKKQQIKKGAMQQLLSGKKRLPGFEGEWEEKRLGNVASCLDNLRVPLNQKERNKMRGSIPYCGANGILDYVNDFVINDDIILIAEDGGYFDEYDSRPIAYRMTGKCWVNNHAHILQAQDDFDQGFLFYSLVHKDITDYITGGTRAKLNKGNMVQIELLAPPKAEEQKAIARILSDMDAEIQTLQAKRSKYQKIKQGMMQELLTGKTRLVPTQVDQSETKDQKKSGHNWQIDEAVLISVLADRFGSKEYPIGRFRRTKLSYLVRRFLASNVDQFLKKAAGPYNHNTRYSGPEKIALDNGYVQEWENGKYSGFIADENIPEAQEYFEGWHGLDALDWLDNGFRYKKNEDLELLTTVDKSIVELTEEGKEVSLKNVKAVIASHPEWEEKLEQKLFSDENIEGAIEESLELFR